MSRYLVGQQGRLSLTYVSGNLTIESNDSLTDLDGLTGSTGITTLVGSLTISESHSLTELSGLSSLTSMGGRTWQRPGGT